MDSPLGCCEANRVPTISRIITPGPSQGKFNDELQNYRHAQRPPRVRLRSNEPVRLMCVQ